MAEVTRADVAAATAPDGGEGGNDPKGAGGETTTPTKPFFNPAAPPAEPKTEGPPAPVTAPPTAPDGPSTASTGDEPSDLDGFSFPDREDIPELLRGKKGSAAVQAYKTLFDTSKRLAAYVRQMEQNPTAAPAAPTAPAKTEPLFSSDDLIGGDPSVFEEKLGQLFERKAAPLLADVYRGLTLQTMNTAKTTLPHYKDYEGEILQELSRTPINLTARFDVWKDAHDRVVARHIDEITAARTTTRPPPPVTERGRGEGPSGGGDLALNADEQKIADGLGVSHAVFARMKQIYNANTGEM